MLTTAAALNQADTVLGTPKTVLFPFLGAELGGSHISAFTLARELKDHFGKRCIVIAAENSAIAKEAERCSFEVLPSHEPPIFSRNNPLVDLRRLLPRMHLLKPFRKDALVHCNDIASLQAWGLAGKMSRIPVVYHHRALNRMVLPNRIVLGFADAVICISDHVRRSLKRLSQARISTILNPFALSQSFDRASSRAHLLQRYGLDSDAVIFGFVGNFWRRKRPYFFLDAAKRIAQVNSKARFVLFGRNGEITEPQLRDHAKALGLADKVIFAGFQLPVERNIAGIDVLLAPATAEPFGRTLIEALLLGTPYVVTNDAGHTEIASRWRGGILVDSQADEAQFAEAALAAAERASSIVLSGSERQRVADELSAREHTENVLRIYERVVTLR